MEESKTSSRIKRACVIATGNEFVEADADCVAAADAGAKQRITDNERTLEMRGTSCDRNSQTQNATVPHATAEAGHDEQRQTSPTQLATAMPTRTAPGDANRSQTDPQLVPDVDDAPSGR